MSSINTYEKRTTDERTISVLLKLLFDISFIALGLRPQTPTVAPPLAGFSMKSPAAYNNNTQYKLYRYYSRNRNFINHFGLYMYGETYYQIVS